LKQSNEALESINEFSTKSFAVLQKEFEKHIKMIKEMKKDLEYIHRKIRHCKAKLNKRFPESAIVKTGC
jgi:peptidoglycan hydrolase CwlO-like protein